MDVGKRLFPYQLIFPATFCCMSDASCAVTSPSRSASVTDSNAVNPEKADVPKEVKLDDNVAVCKAEQKKNMKNMWENLLEYAEVFTPHIKPKPVIRAKVSITTGSDDRFFLKSGCSWKVLSMLS